MLGHNGKKHEYWLAEETKNDADDDEHESHGDEDGDHGRVDVPLCLRGLVNRYKNTREHYL